MARYKRKIDVVPRNRYMSVQFGQLAVADCREIFPGDIIRHRCRIGVHLSPMQAPEFSPIVIRQDTFFVPNRINWNYWDNYISQKLLDDSTVGPFDENKLICPQVAVCLGAGFTAQGGATQRHLSNVRGVYDLLEGLGMKLSYTDTVASTSYKSHTGTVLMFNAFPLMAYWRIWHDNYRDPYLQNDEFFANSSGRIPLLGDPWADEQPVPGDVTVSDAVANNWDSPITGVFAGSPSNLGMLPGFHVELGAGGSTPHHSVRGCFTFAKRHPGICTYVSGLGPNGGSSTSTMPGVVAVIPADLGTYDRDNQKVLVPTGSLGMYAPVCMPKDYIFTARQSPIYNEDVATPASVRDLRKAFQVLGYREKVLRFDNRIKAWMRSMWGVNISDKRLDSPYWLGGSQSIINTQEILGTVNNTDTVLGQLGGVGIGSVRGRTLKMRSEDHGYLMTVFYLAPLPVYGDGVQRFWYRGALNVYARTPWADGALDWPLPDFARIGQQTIYRGEVSVNPAESADGGSDYRAAFGYGDRFSDLSFSCSDVCGDFRTILRFWHTGLFFGLKTTPLVPQDEDLAKVSGVSGDFVSLFNRIQNNQRQSRSGQVRSSIGSMLTARLFDAGVTADPFWVVVSTDFYASRKLPTHPQPGHADHTRRN